MGVDPEHRVGRTRDTLVNTTMTLVRRKVSRSPSPTGVNELESERMLGSRTVLIDTNDGTGHLGITVSNDSTVGGVRVEHAICADRMRPLKC